jgi:two-component system sensor histidine kinase KdpD
MGALSALTWNFFFIPPQYTLYIRKLEDVVMFGMFFIVALSMGHLTSRLRQREAAERRRLRHTTALLRVTQTAALTPKAEAGLSEALATINELLGCESALMVRELDHSMPKSAHAASTFHPTEKEWGVVAWTFENKQAAGRFTDTLPQSEATWFPLQTATSMMGVLGLRMPGNATMDFGTRQMIEAFALQLALVLEKEHFIQAVNRAEVLERSEQLRRTMLDSVSHELKTPLAVMRAALDGLDDAANPYVAEIHTATRRLQRVVDNLLHMTRIESSIVQPQREWCEPSEIIAQARHAAEEALEGHPMHVTGAETLPMVHVDAALIAQALANVLHNAATYSPAGAAIEVELRIRQDRLLIHVRDHGPGLPPGMEKQVFEKFFRVPGSPAGGTGLGLAIARGLMVAQNGEIRGHNVPGGGAEFILELPVKTQTHEESLQA